MRPLPITRRREIVEQCNQARHGGLNQPQTEALHEALARVDGHQAERSFKQAMIADRFSIAHLLEALKADQGPPDNTKPYHPPNCSGGCEGGGWVPGPNAQAAAQIAGEPVRLVRCPAGPEMSQAVWDGIRERHDTEQRGFDASRLVSLTKITHRLDDRYKHS